MNNLNLSEVQYFFENIESENLSYNDLNNLKGGKDIAITLDTITVTPSRL